MDIINEIISERPKLYFCQDEIIDDDVIDPLARLVPCFTDNRQFFGSKVCNIIIFTKLYMNNSSNWDDQVESTKTQLRNTFAKFAKYESHFWIDSSADEILTANSSDINSMDILLTNLANELSSYGVFYHGQLSEDQLKSSIDNVINSFSKIING